MEKVFHLVWGTNFDFQGLVQSNQTFLHISSSDERANGLSKLVVVILSAIYKGRLPGPSLKILNSSAAWRVS
jgi:hypothetical protein